MWTRRYSLLLAPIVALSPALAVAKGSPKTSGVVASSYRTAQPGIPKAEAAVRLKTQRKLGVRGVVKLKARTYADQVELQNAFLDHKASNFFRWQLGYNKKRVGLEYEQSRRERLSPKRSYLYEKLETLGIVGRQLNLRALFEPSQDLLISAGVGADAAHNLNLLSHITHQPGAFGYGAWSLTEAHRVDKGYQFLWAGALAGWHQTSRSRAVIELIAGLDSFETELERQLGEGRRVYFAGPKLELGHSFPLNEVLLLEPFIQSSVAVHDLKHPSHNGIAALAGLNIHYVGIVLGVTAAYRGETEQAAPYQRTHFWPFFTEVKYHF